MVNDCVFTYCKHMCVYITVFMLSLLVIMFLLTQGAACLLLDFCMTFLSSTTT